MKRSIKIRRRETAANKRLTLVNNYARIREVYSRYLSNSGYRVAEARSGVEALAKAFEFLPKMVSRHAKIKN